MFSRTIGILGLLLWIVNPVLADGVGTAGPDQFPQRSGQGLYQALCQSCHMPAGEGAVGAGFYPPLTDNRNLVSSVYLADVILYGLRGMPGFGGLLDDEQVTELVNYVRSNLGNHYTDIFTLQHAKMLRKSDYLYVDMN